MNRFCQLDGSIDFVGRGALMQINETGPERIVRGVLFDGDPCPPCASPWPVVAKDRQVGQITSAIWSPRFEANIALGMLDRGHWQTKTEVSVQCPDGTVRRGRVASLPFE